MARQRFKFWKSWGDVRSSVHRKSLINVEHFFKVEWANITNSRCALLIDLFFFYITKTSHFHSRLFIGIIKNTPYLLCGKVVATSCSGRTPLQQALVGL